MSLRPLAHETSALSPRALALVATLAAMSGWLIDVPTGTPRPGLFLASVAAIAAVWSLVKTRSASKTSLVESLALAIALPSLLGLFDRRAVWLAPGLLVAVTALAWLGRRSGWASLGQRWLRLTLALGTALVTVQLAQEAVLIFHHDTSIFDRLLAVPLSLVVGSVQYRPGALALGDGRSLMSLHFGLEQTHLVGAIRVLAAWVVLGSFGIGRRLNAREVGLGALVSLSVMASWLVGSFSLWWLGREPLALLSRPFAAVCELAGVLLALPLLPGRVRRTALDEVESTAPSWSRRGVAVRACVVAAGALIAVFGLWYPSGLENPSRVILVDDAHSPWEKSELAFDLTDPGMSKASAYSFTSFVNYLRRSYPVRIKREGTFDARQLADVAVVILKTPTTPLQPAEIAALRDFAREGGGLFLMGDHTNLYGMSEIFNDLLGDSGLAFNYDDEADFEGRPSVSSVGRSIAAHPTVAGLPALQFLTSCTIRPLSLLVEPVVVSANIFSENAHFGRPGFFGNMRYDGGERVGRLIRAAVVPYGRGRIAAFSDSTIFSNFAAFNGPQSDYATRTIEYLRHEASPIRPILLASAIGLLILAVPLGWGTGIDVGRLATVTLGVGLGLGVIAGTGLRAWSNPDVNIPRGGDGELGLVLENATVSDCLTVGQLPESALANDFGGLTTTLERIGLYPKVEESLTSSVARYATSLVVHPTTEWTPSELGALEHAVKHEGKRIVVIDTPANRGSTAAKLLQPFGLRPAVLSRSSKARHLVAAPRLASDTPAGLPFALEALARSKLVGELVPVEPEDALEVRSPRSFIEGGQTLISDGEGTPLLVARAFLSGGAVYVLSDSSMLSTLVLGGGFMKTIEPEQRAAIRSAARLIEEFRRPLEPSAASETHDDHDHHH